ncbi:spore germination protein PB [Salinibacillus kushneri]|uniref:Spore germination protein PB n=1 Tax=Salinibacillus kushneri TaxID=237682 RepID=A0A1I0J281_9BACI|nr:spore germination protein GerPB [Salinibacillus kushneri]SEU03814.1 spore germination protein PB [Salinibacillus kushneri]
MNFTIYQNISIRYLRVGSVTNSSVLQIGSSGTIQGLSNLYNTGGYTQPAEEAEPIGENPKFQPFVPLSPPS